MAAVPVWAKLVAVLVAIATVPWTALLVVAIAISLTWTNADLDRTTTFAVSQAPTVHVNGGLGRVIVQAGRDGQVVVEDQQSVEAMTRAFAVRVLRQTAVRTSRDGDTITVDQVQPDFHDLGFSRDPGVTIRVPVHTALDISDANVEVHGIDGSVHYRGSGTVTIRNTVLRGTSTLEMDSGMIDLRDVTVAGTATLANTDGPVNFAGSLVPGGSTLHIRTNHDNVTLALPRPTDAQAVITTSILHADPAWGIAIDPNQPPYQAKTWTLDLGPDPKGTLTVEASFLEFDVR